MKHPEKWRETIDPYSLPYQNFTLKEVIGYPHAGNDVFQVIGIYRQQEVEAFVKAASQRGADIKREIDTISALNWNITPEVIDHDEQEAHFVVTLAKDGERLSTILGANENLASMDYLFEYGQTLAKLHSTTGNFSEVKDRPYFHIPPLDYFEKNGLRFVYEYLLKYQPKEINRCFCHGDFHYANILWKDKHISAILDFELSGIGNKEFDIAWALSLRPGQRFLKTEVEIALFLDGYCSEGICNLELVKYYMILIYSRFYEVGASYDGYQNYIIDAFRKICATSH